MSEMMYKISLFGLILIGGCSVLTAGCRNGQLLCKFFFCNIFFFSTTTYYLYMFLSMDLNNNPKHIFLCIYFDFNKYINVKNK